MLLERFILSKRLLFTLHVVDPNYPKKDTKRPVATHSSFGMDRPERLFSVHQSIHVISTMGMVKVRLNACSHLDTSSVD